VTYIVDASVAAKWFVRETLHDQARTLLHDHGDDLEAPDLLLTEVANIVWKKVRRDEIIPEQARAILPEVRASIAAFHASTDLVERALEIAVALRHPVYDCLYLACAEATDRLLVTADEKLVAAVRIAGVAGLVCHLGEFPATAPH